MDLPGVSHPVSDKTAPQTQGSWPEAGVLPATPAVFVGQDRSCGE